MYHLWQASSAQSTIQNMGKALPHTSTTFIPSAFRLVLRGRLEWNQAERERHGLGKIIREQQRKIAGEERKTKEEEDAQLCKPCALDLINTK